MTSNSVTTTSQSRFQELVCAGQKPYQAKCGTQFEQEKYKTKIKAITYQVSSEECTASGSLHGILFQMIADKNEV